jgi:hypothetical protein
MDKYNYIPDWMIYTDSENDSEKESDKESDTNLNMDEYTITFDSYYF